MIEKHNAESESFVLGHNKFSTWSKMEMERLYGKKGKTSAPKQVEAPTWVYKSNDEQGIDWRKKGVVTPVKDQGQCGDPHMYTAVDEMSMAHSARSGSTVTLSIQQMIDCYSNGSPCGAVRGENPYTYIQHFGLASEQEYPHTGEKEKCKFHESMAIVKVEKMNYLD